MKKQIFACLMLSQFVAAQTIVVSGPIILSGNLNGTSNPVISSASPLTAGNQNIPYIFSFQGTGGVTPYVWTKTLGTLPSGMTLNSSTGALQGTDTTAETANFTVQLADANGSVTTKAFAVTIN